MTSPHATAAELVDLAHGAFLDMNPERVKDRVMALDAAELRPVLHSLATLAGCLASQVRDLDRRLLIDSHAAYVSSETTNV